MRQAISTFRASVRAPRFCAGLIPDLDTIARRFGYRQIAPLVIAVAATLAVVFGCVYFLLLTGSVPAWTPLVAVLTAISAGTPLTILMMAAIRRIDRMGRAVRDQARTLDERNTALAAAEEALRHANERLETRVRERTEALDAAREEAERANEEKTLFLASMSHELRTPLNAIIGFSDMLVNRRALFGEAGDGRVDEYGGIVNRAGLHLLSLVEDLLDLSRLSCGQGDLTTTRLDTATVVTEAVHLLEHQAANRGQAVVTRLDEAPRHFEGDARAMQQILANLLSNALKFSPEGAPIVLTVTGDGSGTTFSIADRGPGMTEAEAREAIRPFARLSDAHVAAGQSVGLGLPIVDTLVRLHGGALSFEGGASGGSVARVRVPRRAA